MIVAVRYGDGSHYVEDRVAPKFGKHKALCATVDVPEPLEIVDGLATCQACCAVRPAVEAQIGGAVRVPYKKATQE